MGVGAGAGVRVDGGWRGGLTGVGYGLDWARAFQCKARVGAVLGGGGGEDGRAGRVGGAGGLVYRL